MATRKNTPPATPKVRVELVISRDDAKNKLQERVQKALEIKQIQITSGEKLDSVRKEFDKWDDFNTELLKRIFTTEELSDEYGESFGFGFVGMYEPSLGELISDLYKSIDGKVHKLDSIIERLELIPLSTSTSGGASEQASRQARPQVSTSKVFIVHGHDEVAKTSLEVFLREIGLDPVVLHRQADEGMTVIEKFEKHSDVGYAFILLTPDEIAYLASEHAKKDDERKKERRARPNVIFEFGYFVGKLGRSKVCCLHTGDVVLPSDLGGVIYKKFNANIEEVAYSIIKDLKASGYSIA